MKKVIRGGTVVTATDTVEADVLIYRESVVAVASNGDVEGAAIIEADG